MEQKESSANRSLTERDSRDIICFVKHIPNGMMHLSGRFEGLVVASGNIGTWKLTETQMIADECHRGALNSYIEEVEVLSKVFVEVTGRNLQPVFIHGGIDAGYFRQLYPEMDIVTIRPLVLYEHMVTQRLALKSFDEIWRVLVKVLEEL